MPRPTDPRPRRPPPGPSPTTDRISPMRIALIAACLALAACAGPADRLVTPPVTPEGSARIAFASVEVRDLSLPSYAQDEEVYVEGEGGLIRRADRLLWADDPVRGATLDLVRGLGALTGARIAGEPWPFDGYPDARLEVRIEEFVASEAAQAFRISGQYFVADLSGNGRDRSGRFAIAVPLATLAAAAIADARAAAMADLARTIAEDGLR